MSPGASAEELAPELPGMRFIRHLGSGGFADVYLYERERPKEKVAVKLLKPLGLDDPRRRQFEAEADSLAALGANPYVAHVYSEGTAPDGRPYMLMRYYPSEDLAARVSENPMSVADAVRFGIRLAGAVETAHRAGIVHRDIKPSNVLVSANGWPALSDFGIAGRLDVEVAGGDLAVSVAWSPPEVLSGKSDGSFASDIYSLAATIWNLITGRAPYETPGEDNSDRAMLPRILHSKPPATGRDEAPASLDRLLQKALAKDPADRPQTAFEFARHLQRIERELNLGETEIIVNDPEIETGPSQVDLVPQPQVPVEPLPKDNSYVAGGDPDPGRTILKIPTVVSGAQVVVGATQAVVPPTHRRPPSVTDAQEEPSLPPEQVSRRKPIVAVGAGGAVVVLAVAIPLLLVHKGHGPPTTSAGTIKSTANSNGRSNVLPAVAAGAPDPQPVAARIRGREVVFSWAGVPKATRYEWSTTPNGTPHQITATRVVVPRASAGPTCILVHSVTPGAPDTPGTRKCAE
jgi:eukaryotic-like serine/threonine-protein kinase